MSSSFENFDEDQIYMEIQSKDEGESSSSFSMVQLTGLNTDGQSVAFYKNGNLESQEEATLATLENEEDFKKEKEAETAKEKKEIRNKLAQNALVLKAVMVLLMCLLLWNCVLVVIVMSYTSSISPLPNPNPTAEFLAHVNRTQEIIEILQQLQQDLESAQSNDGLKFEEIKRRINSVEEILEILKNSVNSSEAKFKDYRNSSETRFESLSNSVEEKLQILEHWRNSTERRFDEMKNSTERKFDEIQNSTERRFDEIQNSTEKRFDEIQNSTERIFDDMKNSTERRFDDMKNSTEKKFDDMKNSTERRFDEIQNSTEAKFESLRNSTNTEIESCIDFTEDKFESWRDLTQEKLKNLTTFTEEKCESLRDLTEEKVDSFYKQLEKLQNDTKQEVAKQAEKLGEAEETWTNANTELAKKNSENSRLLRNLEYKTNQLDLNAQELQEKLEPILKKFLYGNFYSAKKLDLELCGGVFNISEMVILRYSPPSSSRSSSSCAWLVWSTAMTQIKIRLFDLNGEMTVYTNFQRNGSWTSPFKLTLGNVSQEISVGSNIALLVFTPSSSSLSSNRRNPDSGFEVGFAQGAGISGSPLVSLMSDANPAVRKQLPSSNGYTHNQRYFYIVYPPPGQRVNLKMESIDTENRVDLVTIFKFGSPSSPQNFQLLSRYSGTRTIGRLFEGGKNQPLILYFSTNESVNKTGFRASIVTVQV